MGSLVMLRSLGQVPVPGAVLPMHVNCDLVNMAVIVFLWESLNAI